MSALPYLGIAIPPLPQGWTEHLGPNGQPYYYNAVTRESTYIRPTPQISPIQPKKASKKEKPLLKTPIPGTDWLKVTTTEGNIFYSHKVRKESVWVVPDELKPALDALQAKENESRGKSAQKTKETTSIAKRKADDTVPISEVVLNKKAKVDEEGEEEDESESEEDNNEEDEEDWQREAAQQLAKEAEEERQRIRDTEKQREAEAEAQRTQVALKVAIPDRVDLSPEEGKALFKTLLREKDINPLHPWDKSLPKFISDPRYVLLQSVTARREAFDEYCKERSRELRQSAVKKDKEMANPKEDFERLLKEEVKSTRTSWTDFRRSWKKDRRFYGWGRDDKEREKRFREFLKELGELKREAAQKAERNFFALLKEHPFVTEGIAWKDAKKKIYKDPRYDAVGSSTLREELFNTFIKDRGFQHKPEQNAALQPNSPTTYGQAEGEEREERRKKAVKEREEKVNAERRRLDADIERSKMGIDKEEGERTFRTLLTDAIRESQVTWDDIVPQLKTDLRFTNSPLSLNHQLRLFHEHLSHLRDKQLTGLHALFEAHAPSLATKFHTLPLETILSSAPAKKLGYNIDQIEADFDKWQRERTTAARIAFDEMMEENSFVEFWGRLRKIGGEDVAGNLQIEGDDIGEDGEDKVDMKALAKNIDIREMENVLKHDKRYITFEHIPDERERWIRDYISRLSAPKLSVHVDG
ncbi:Transcription elongation regulator 1 [Psilocybe cubensis]|uniref:Transcription elongation regulator 1 n=2 Tax=Psilocybe cubensis TaxID=181762 RepID=A0ACB8H456_PSICU|nr:Transcription elongation regulator 1 [Psilocybe cubensis]KAH9482626.1 Transcription elongation regulator 1 [Psilocybe cubensis]